MYYERPQQLEIMGFVSVNQVARVAFSVHTLIKNYLKKLKSSQDTCHHVCPIERTPYGFSLLLMG
jgi:hypothetical protein